MKLLKKIIPFLLLLVLAGIGLYFFLNKGKSTLEKSEFDFKIRDTSAVESIYIYNQNDTIHLFKENSIWKVNGHFFVNNAMLKLCFRVFKDAEIQSVFSSDMATKAQELFKLSPLVALHLNNGETKEFHIFSNKMARQVWMMKKDGKQPFVIYIPSYEGNFAALFYAQANDWRDNNISLLLHGAKSLEINHINKPEKSFKIDFSKTKPILFLNQEPSNNYSQEALEQYLSTFRRLTISRFVYSPVSRDSLAMQKHNIELRIVFADKPPVEIKIYPKGFPADLNEAYVLMNNSDMAVVKYVAIDPLLPDNDFFKN